MKKRWAMAMRGVWRSGGEAVFFSWAVFLAVAAVTGMLATAESMHHQVDQDARRALSADLRVESAAPFDAWIDAHVRQPGRVVAQNLELTAMVRLAGSGQTVLADVLAAAPEHPLRGVVELASGRSLSQALAGEGAVVETALQTRLGLSIGQDFYLGEARFQLADLLVREPDRVTRFFRWGPRLVIPRQRLAETGLLKVGSRVLHVALVGLAPGEDVEQVARHLKEVGAGLALRVQTPAESQPSAHRFIQRFTLFLGLVTLLTLLTTGHAMAGSMAAYVREHRAELAIYKSLGASHGQVMELFFWRVLWICAPGSLAGAAVGVLTSGWLTGWGEAGLMVLSAWSIFLQGAGLGIVLGWLFSLGPVWGTRNIGPDRLFREVEWSGGLEWLHWKWRWGLPLMGALAGAWYFSRQGDWRAGVLFVGELAVLLVILSGAAIGSGWVLRRLRINWLVWRLAVGGLLASRSGFVGSVVAVGLGLSVVCAIGFLEQNLDRQLVSRLPQRAPDLFLIDVQADQEQDLRALSMDFVRDARDLRLTPVVRGRIKRLKGVEVTPEWVARVAYAWRFSRDYVLTWSRDMPAGNRLVAGRWWSDDAAREVSVEWKMAQELGLQVGDSLAFDILGVEVEARIVNLREVHWTDLGLNFFVVFSPAVLSGAPFSYLGSVEVESGREEAYRAAVVERFHNVSVVAVGEVMQAALGLLRRLVGSVRWSAGLAIMAGLVALGVSVALTRRRRTREAAIRRVLGATQRDLLLTAVLEYGLLGLVASVAGVVVGQLVTAGVMGWWLGDQWDWLPGWSLFALVFGLVVVALTGVLVARADLQRGIMSALHAHD